MCHLCNIFIDAKQSICIRISFWTLSRTSNWNSAIKNKINSNKNKSVILKTKSKKKLGLCTYSSGLGFNHLFNFDTVRHFFKLVLLFGIYVGYKWESNFKADMLALLFLFFYVLLFLLKTIKFSFWLLFFLLAVLLLMMLHVLLQLFVVGCFVWFFCSDCCSCCLL